jgi:SAM-dependent methyltransferase
VHEILRQLRAGEIVLDLGSRTGSFDAAATAALTVRVDLDPSAKDAAVRTHAVRADAAALPFREGCVAAIIANHSLEHFVQLDEALREAKRVLRRRGAFFVAVPDAGTLTDRIYRWLGRGGGHVNPFRSRGGLVQQVETLTGLAHAGGRVLCTSLSFLNSHNHTGPAPRKLLLLGGGNERILRWLNGLLRCCDRLLGTRACVYGWALYFGSVSEPVESKTWVNVCVRCGRGHDSDLLLKAGQVWTRLPLLRFYRCPSCHAANLFFADGAFARLH